jgi:hypothetical protein
MAKFGLYDAGSKEPLQEYDGDSLQLSANGESVSIVVSAGIGADPRTVAVIRLAERQSVKQVK